MILDSIIYNKCLIIKLRKILKELLDLDYQLQNKMKIFTEILNILLKLEDKFNKMLRELKTNVKLLNAQIKIELSLNKTTSKQNNIQ